ncbi:MAG TPA: P-loop NTPase fold protein [Ilumatobacteraceae bacterium]|nr:P-loop NTPase fold protein [Ilumatobacteraceae bacterium]
MIEDREVREGADDRLQHGQIGQQLADLAMSVPTPSNIALYGAWGSGKSGVGNLVRCHLESKGHLDKRGEVAFARFDAFKYAENPLRRNFVTAMATELGIDDDAFHEDLYAGTTNTKLKFPLGQTARLVAIFVAFLGLVVALLTGGCLLVAWLQQGDTSDNFGKIAKVLFAAALAPAALLAAFVALGGKTLNVDRRIDKADSHEQFEKLFRSLVKKTGKKVVVFVDELDRCSASNVVATLDAMRTFLGVPGCVFIVAADRQVLEQALTTALQQATPSDTVNPYYSEGSAYLDKVFQYEVTVPPLLQHSVTRFAVELVDGRPGLWCELHDLELVVSILVPSHVRSPRRVKALLNAFALAYRLAEARERSGLLKTDVRGRAAEIARLVCLRIEFPLFAQYLVMDHRLPVYVLSMDTPEHADALWERFPFATDEVREVAKRFAEIQASVATLISSPEDEDEDIDVEVSPSTLASAVGRKAGRQLLDYLSRTRDVPGPGRDLIHLRSTGSVVGLESDQAEAIEEMASNGSVGQIVEMVERFDEASTQAVLGLLIEHARGAIGVESQGVARTLLALAGSADVALNQHGGAIANSIAPTLELYPELLASSSLSGAWRLGSVTNSTAGRRLQRIVLDSAATRTDPGVGLMVLRDACAALAADAAATQLILQSHLVAAHVADTAAVIEGLDPGTAADLLRGDPASLAATLAAALTPPVAPAAAPTTPPAPAAAPAAAVSTADEDEEDDASLVDGGRADSTQVHAALVGLLSNLASGPDGPAQALLGVLLLVDSQEMRDTVQASLSSVGDIEDPELTSRILTSCCRRGVSAWPRWMDSLSPVVLADARFDNELDAAARLLWTRAAASDKRATDAALASAGAALLRLVEGRPLDRWPSLDDEVEAALGTCAEDDVSALRRTDVLTNAAPLVEAGLLPVRTLAKAEYDAAVQTLEIDKEPELLESELVSYIVETIARAIVHWDPTLPTGGAIEVDELAALAVAADGCGWLPEPQASVVKLTLRAAWAPADQTSLAALPLTDEMVQLWGDFSTPAAPAVQAWLTLAQLSAADVVAIGSAFVTSQPPASVLAALGNATVGLNRTSRLEALQHLLVDPAGMVPSRAVLDALGAPSVSAADLAQMLIARYTACGNNHQRKQVLELWGRLDISATARRDLIDRIVIPMFGLNQQAKEHALDYVERLCLPFPPKTKKRLGDVIVGATRGTSIEKRSQDKMKAMGYSVKKTGGFLGLGKTTLVDTGSDED